MKQPIIYFAAIFMNAGLFACNNPTSEPHNESSQAYESMAVAADTINQHATGFTTAMHQMMNDMHQLPMSGNTDKDFALMMKSHHQGAVDMSQVELSQGKDQGLKKLAAKIAGDQLAEIKQLEEIISGMEKAPKNYDPEKKQEGFAKVMNDNMGMMMEMSKMDTSMAPDHQFVAMMIPHHQSAVFMSEGFLKYGKDPQLLSMARKIIVNQKKEIDTFQSWMNKHKD